MSRKLFEIDGEQEVESEVLNSALFEIGSVQTLVPALRTFEPKSTGKTQC